MARLQGLSVLITRPEPAASELAHLLAAEGARAIALPTLAFAPPPDKAGFHQALQDLAEQDYAIFTSPQAVKAGLLGLQQLALSLPAQLKLAAIGPGTAALLQTMTAKPVICPSFSAAHSEGLLALTVMQEIAGRAIAVIRGVGGREYLEAALKERGAYVTSILAYQRILPLSNCLPVIQLLQHHTLDVIIGTSFTSLTNLKELLGPDHWPLLQNIPLLVVSERIKTLAQQLGFRTIWVALNASHTALLAALLEKRRN